MFNKYDIYYGHNYRFEKNFLITNRKLIPVDREVFVANKISNLDVFTGEELADKLKIGSAIHIQIGYSKCHPKDNFDKKIGRELARQRMKEEILEVTKIVLTKDEIYVTLSNESYELEYNIVRGKEYFRLYGAEKHE